MMRIKYANRYLSQCFKGCPPKYNPSGFANIRQFSDTSSISKTDFSIVVNKADFKFNCAHFIAREGFRERLHGHNYTISLRVTGDDVLGSDGYLIDFKDIKVVTSRICREMNEYFICPMNSNVMEIKEENNGISLECEDGAKFVFPKSDCAMLPIVHSSAEEIARYLWGKLVNTFGLNNLLRRGIKVLEVAVYEIPTQQAIFRSQLPPNEEALKQLQLEWIAKVRPAKGCFEE